MNRTAATVLLVFMVLLVVMAGCDETFPPYTTPENVLEGWMSGRSGDTVSVFYFPATDGYFVTSGSPIEVFLRNAYDDLLQGEAAIGERLTIQSFGANPEVIVVPINLGNLRTPSVFRGNVAIRPGDTARFQVPWLPVNKANRPIYLGMPFTVKDSTKVYGPVEFIVDGEVRLFERVQSVVVQRLRFKLYFREYETD